MKLTLLIMLDDLLRQDEGLHSGELDFIEDLDQHWRGKDLTERQSDWLEKIWERIC